MKPPAFNRKDEIRNNFAIALSEMYQQEVPEYTRLVTLVKQSNNRYLQENSIDLSVEEFTLLNKERHGAIRVGTAKELFNLRRVFYVMGMCPVDYYDLSVAGIPVHSTAFRALSPKQLQLSPFRIFTSLLRLDLIKDEELQEEAKKLLGNRNIFSDQLLALLDKSESQHGLTKSEAKQFVSEALEIFRWHQQANASKKQYDALYNTHRLIADVVSFKGPHINHLTPRVLDIDDVQNEFAKQGFKAKVIIEGPPKRACDILLRQTSFIALDEAVTFSDGCDGTHTARFGEVEQRGIALTRKGRKLYDKLLDTALNADKSIDYVKNLENAFVDFPDSYDELREQELAYFYYYVSDRSCNLSQQERSLEGLIKNGNINFQPIQYEDFLPVSAAGIFTSNLAADGDQRDRDKRELDQRASNQSSFEEALGAKVNNSFDLYKAEQQASIEVAMSYF